MRRAVPAPESLPQQSTYVATEPEILPQESTYYVATEPGSPHSQARMYVRTHVARKLPKKSFRTHVRIQRYPGCSPENHGDIGCNPKIKDRPPLVQAIPMRDGQPCKSDPRKGQHALRTRRFTRGGDQLGTTVVLKVTSQAQ